MTPAPAGARHAWPFPSTCRPQSHRPYRECRLGGRHQPAQPRPRDGGRARTHRRRNQCVADNGLGTWLPEADRVERQRRGARAEPPGRDRDHANRMGVMAGAGPDGPASRGALSSGPCAKAFNVVVGADMATGIQSFGKCSACGQSLCRGGFGPTKPALALVRRRRATRWPLHGMAVGRHIAQIAPVSHRHAPAPTRQEHRLLRPARRGS